MGTEVWLNIMTGVIVCCVVACLAATYIEVRRYMKNPPVKDFPDLFDRHPRLGKIEMERGDQWTIYYHDAANPNEPFPLSSLRPDSQLRQDIERLDRRATI